MEQLGMTTVRVHAGFIDTRTRPAGRYPLPELGPLNKQFFSKLQTRPVGLYGPRGPRPIVSKPNQKLWPNTTQS